MAECFLLAGFIPLSAQVLEDVAYINETMPGGEYAGYTLNNVTFEDSVNDLILFGEDATIVIAVYDSNDAVQAAFINLFQDFDGNSVDWSPDTVADFVVGGAAIPEPSCFAVIFGFFALCAVLRAKRTK